MNVPIASLALLILCTTTPHAEAQRLARPIVPTLESHTGPVLLAVGLGSAGILGLSTAVNTKRGDTPNQKRGTLAYTLPIAWTLAVVGAATQEPAVMLGGFISGGLLGGAVGRRAGTHADSTGKDGSIDAMVVLSIVGVGLLLGLAVVPIGD